MMSNVLVRRRILAPLVLAVAAAVPASGQAAAGDGDAVQARQAVVERALAWLDTPYLYGGSGSQGLDCSGLVYRVFRDAGERRMPRNVEDQILAGSEVGEPLPADLLFFDTTGTSPSHVGIYLGEGRFVHSASEGPRTGVIVSSLDEPYYRSRLVGIRRYIHQRPGEVRMALTSEGRTERCSLKLGPGTPLRVVLDGRAVAQDRVRLRISGPDGEVMTRSLRLDADRLTSLVWYQPRTSDWMFQVDVPEGADTEGKVLGTLILLEE